MRRPAYTPESALAALYHYHGTQDQLDAIRETYSGDPRIEAAARWENAPLPDPGRSGVIYSHDTVNAIHALTEALAAFIDTTL